MFSLICVWINDWVNNLEAGHLICYRAHYDVTVIESKILIVSLSFTENYKFNFCEIHCFWHASAYRSFPAHICIKFCISHGISHFRTCFGSCMDGNFPMHPGSTIWRGVLTVLSYPWWRHQMETFSALLAICAGNSPIPGEFPAERPVTRSFDVFFDLRLNKRLSKQPWGWWFETLSRPLWRHRKAEVNLKTMKPIYSGCPLAEHLSMIPFSKKILSMAPEFGLNPFWNWSPIEIYSFANWKRLLKMAPKSF